MPAAVNPLVLLHGWAATSRVWGGLIAALPLRLDLRAADLPAHGDTRDSAPAAFDDAVDLVARELAPASVVCGWSLGGLFALRLATRYPGRVASLVLIGATPCFVARGDWTTAMAAHDFDAFAQGMRETPGATLARFAALCALGGRDGREVTRTLRATMQAPAPAGLAWLRDADLRAEVASVDVPALLLHGVEDRVTPVAAARWLAATLPRARLVEIDDGAHVPHVSHRERVARELEAFVG